MKVFRNHSLTVFFLFSIFCTSCLLIASQANAAQDGFQGPAGQQQSHGGFTGPEPAMSTVKQALKMSDDSPVALKGNITQSLGDESYQFKDGTGNIILEIDREHWLGQNVTPADTVIIYGEVEKDFMESTEIDVYHILKQ